MAARFDTTFPAIRARHETANLRALRDLFEHQQAAVIVAGRLLSEDWDDELAGLVQTRMRNTAADIGIAAAVLFGGDEFDADRLTGWLSSTSDLSARFINDTTRRSLEQTDDAAKVFEQLRTADAERYARSMVTSAAGIAINDAARANGIKSKTWTVTSNNPREKHIAMNGQTVGVDDEFRNGMRWPGDPSGGADNNAGCQCVLFYS